DAEPRGERLPGITDVGVDPVTGKGEREDQQRRRHQGPVFGGLLVGHTETLDRRVGEVNRTGHGTARKTGTRSPPVRNGGRGRNVPGSAIAARRMASLTRISPARARSPIRDATFT